MTTKTEEARQELFGFIEDHSSLNDDGTILFFDTLYNYDKDNRIRIWYMALQILDSRTMKPNIIEQDELGKNSRDFGSYYKVSGLKEGKKIQSSPTIITIGKSIGRANETTPILQALISIKNQYSKELKEGYKYSEAELLREDDIKSLEDLLKLKHLGPKPWRVFGMAMDKLDLNGEKNWNKLKYDVYAQPKLDGVMGMLVSYPNLPETEMIEKSKLYKDAKIMDLLNNKYPKGIRVDKFTRSREQIFSHVHIDLLWSLLADKYPGLYLVGEFYKKGMPLQDINSTIGRIAENSEHDVVDFWVFDTFYIGEKNGYKERKMRTDKISLEFRKIIDDLELEKKYAEIGMLRFLPTKRLKNKAQVLEYYGECISKKTEGLVVRNTTSLYEYGINKEIRVSHTLKLKERFDDEWPVVGFTHGTKGKGVNAVVWICAIKSDQPLEKRKTFHVSYNATDEMREQIYKILSEDEKFFRTYIYGKDLTINYSIMSSEQTPLQPKGVRFRDTDIEILLKHRINNVKGGKDELNSLLSRIIESVRIQQKNRDDLSRLTSKWNVEPDKIVQLYNTGNLDELLHLHYENIDPNYVEKGLDFGKYDLVIMGDYDNYDINSNTKVISYYELNVMWDKKHTDHKSILSHRVENILFYNVISKIENLQKITEFIEKILTFNPRVMIEIRDYSVDTVFGNSLHTIGDIINYLNNNRSSVEFSDIMLSYKGLDNNYYYRNMEEIITMLNHIKGIKMIKHTPPEFVYPANYVLYYSNQ